MFQLTYIFFFTEPVIRLIDLACTLNPQLSLHKNNNKRSEKQEFDRSSVHFPLFLFLRGV